MKHATYVSVKHMGPGEWVGQCLRRLVQAYDDRPIVAINTPSDWRFDWTGNIETRRQYREFRFE